MLEFEPNNTVGHTRMLELLVVEILVVGTWIGFVAYGAWFFSSAKKREREQAEVQECFSGLYDSSKDAMFVSARRKRKKQERISRHVSAPEQVRKEIPKPPKRPHAPKQNKVVPKTEETIYCIQCGEKLPSHAMYCRKCGNKVE